MKLGHPSLSRFVAQYAEYMILFIFSLFLLCYYYFDFLYLTQELSFFSASEFFHNELLQRSAGPLIYVSTYLTQLFYYPIIGVLLITFTLLLDTFLIKRLLHVTLFAYIPTLLLLLSFTTIGYSIYDTFPKYHVISSLIGFTYLVLFSSIFAKKGEKLLIAAILLSILGYFVVGIYAGAALLSSQLILWLKEKEKTCVIGCVTALLLLLLLPFFTSTFLYHERYLSTLIAPLPNPRYALVLGLSLFTLFSLPLFYFLSSSYAKTHEKMKEKKTLLLHLSILCVACLAVFFVSYKNPSFRTEMKVLRLAEKQKWGEIVKETQNAPSLTQSLYSYRLVALANRGELTSRMFAKPYEIVRIPKANIYIKPISIEDLYLYSSFVNESYLYSMEFWTSIGYSYQRLKRMTICALLSGEYNMAKRYIGILKQTMFQKKWAEEYEKYANNPDLLFQKYSYLQAVRSQMPTQRKKIEMGSFANIYQQYSQLSFCHAERKLLTDLYRKDLKSFSSDILPMKGYYATHEIPSCIKEGIVLCAMNGDLKPIQNFKVERNFSDQMKAFTNYAQNFSDEKEAYAPIKKRFGNTYQFYYYFSNKNNK